MDIEKECTRENIKKFTQANDTPPMSNTFRKFIGRWSKTRAAQSVLDRNFNAPPGTDPHLVELLKYMKMPRNIAENSSFRITVDAEDNTRFWRKQKVKTSSEGLGPGFLEMKAAAEDKHLSTFDAKLRNIPMKFGFLPTAWREMTEVKILKKAEVWDVEKLRTIILMHLFFNANNKKLGKETLKYAESKKAIAREQYGSQKEHSCIRAVLNK